MIRPTLPSSAGRQKQRQPSLGFASVFRTIAESFKTAPHPSRHKKLPIIINPTVVGGTADQEELFKSIRSPDVTVRSKAIISLMDSLEKYSISSIPEIWYAAKDLLEADNDREARRNCLLLLLSCIKHDDLSSAAIRLTYYEDIITYCEMDYFVPTIDENFDLFLECLVVLTKNGEDIQDYCLNERCTLQYLLSLSLALTFSKNLGVEETSEENTFLKLMKFTQNCISHNNHMFDEKSIVLITQQLVTMIMSCPSRTIMTSLLQFIEFFVVSGMPTSALFALTEALAFLFSVEKERSWEIFQLLLTDHLYSALVIMNLCDMITVAGPSSDLSKEDCLTVVIGSIDVLARVMTDATFETVYETTKNLTSLILESLQTASTTSEEAVAFHIMKFFQEVVQKNPLIFGYESWFGDEKSILHILQNIRKSPSNNDDMNDIFKEILGSITSLAAQKSLLIDEAKLVEFYLEELSILTDKDISLLLIYFDSLSMCLPFSGDFERNLSTVSQLSHNDSLSPAIRLRCFHLLQKSLLFGLGEDELSNRVWEKYLLDIFCVELSLEKDDDILRSILGDFLAEVFLLIADKTTFCELFTRVADVYRSSKNQMVHVCIAKTISRLFILTAVVHHDRFKSAECFNGLITLAETSIALKLYEPLLVISKVMIRIRVRGPQHSLFFTNPKDMEGLSAAFNRNFSEAKEMPNDVQNLAWYYPESIDYIPPEYINEISRAVTRDAGLRMSAWLSIVVDIMENFYDWELYSFIWSHFCPQLSELELFVSSPPLKEEISSLLRLRVLVCNQLSSKLPADLKFPKGLTKADLQIAVIRTLTALIAFHDFFAKADEDALISATVDGLSTSWEKTAIPSIHFLNLCCYEIPLSVKKYLSLILIKLQTRISSFFASPHILEFLMALSHLPSLSSNFNLDEYKRIFGILLQFIEFYKITKSNSLKKEDSVFVNKHGEDVKVENIPSTELINITPALSQYLVGLSYSVISSWFLKMKLSERRELEPFIVRNLMLASNTSQTVELDDQTLGFLDFISRFSFTNSELKIRKNLKIVDVDGSRSTTWVHNSAVISLSTSILSSKIIIRKAADSILLDLTQKQDWDKFHESKLQMSKLKESMGRQDAILDYGLYSADTNESLSKLSNVPSAIRSIDNLDRLPVVQFVKAGIIYVGPSQESETEIFANRFGSSQYQSFLSGIGQYIRLKDCDSVYVGGLDTENDIDGEFALFWRDKITQLIFHTTTLMPNNTHDVSFSAKKRHVGNNYVNIYFYESGLPFDFNIIKSQFNFINIVVSPESRSYYRVKVYRRNGVPAIFAACHFKLISESKLAPFVRNLVLICYEFSNVWNAEGQFISSWSRRVNQIKKLSQLIEQAV